MLFEGAFNGCQKKQCTFNLLVFQHSLFKRDTKLTNIVLNNWTELGESEQLPTLKGESFPKKLRRILDFEEARNAIWWLDDATSFAIDEVLFTHNILTQHYGGIKFDSFKRNLYRWYVCKC